MLRYKQPMGLIRPLTLTVLLAASAGAQIAVAISDVTGGNIRAEETLTNDVIGKLAHAGLADEVICRMIANQPGKYSLDSDDIIALKQDGVSEKVLAAMLFQKVPTAVSTDRIPAETVVLQDSTPVRLRLKHALSSADAKPGQRIDFEVVDDVVVSDLVIIPSGTVALGTITGAEKKKWMARGGKLEIDVDFVRLRDGEKVLLRGGKGTVGAGHTGVMAGAMVVSAIVFWPAAPAFLLISGRESTITEGAEITAYTSGDVNLDRRSLAAGQQKVATMPQPDAEEVRHSGQPGVLVPNQE